MSSLNRLSIRANVVAVPHIDTVLWKDDSVIVFLEDSAWSDWSRVRIKEFAFRASHCAPAWSHRRALRHHLRRPVLPRNCSSWRSRHRWNFSLRTKWDQLHRDHLLHMRWVTRLGRHLDHCNHRLWELCLALWLHWDKWTSSNFSDIWLLRGQLRRNSWDHVDVNISVWRLRVGVHGLADHLLWRWHVLPYVGRLDRLLVIDRSLSKQSTSVRRCVVI